MVVLAQFSWWWREVVGATRSSSATLIIVPHYGEHNAGSRSNLPNVRHNDCITYQCEGGGEGGV